MRLIKMFGLAAIAAVAAMAFIGASSASAAVLCETTPTLDKSNGETFCHSKWDVSAGGVIKATTTEHTLLTTNIANVTCPVAHTELKITDTGGTGKPVIGSVTSLEFTSCKMTSFPFSGCTVEVKNLPYSGEGVVGENHDGFLQKVKGSGGTSASARVVCAGFIDCTFGAPEGLKLEVKSGNPATVTAKEQALNKEAGGFLCPKTSTFHAKFEATGETDEFYFADRAEP